MAQITFFRYIHKDTILHRMDPRLKLLCLLLLSLSASLAAEPCHYFVPLFIVAIALFAARLPILALLRDMWFFALLIIIVLVSNAFNVPGDPIPEQIFGTKIISWIKLPDTLRYPEFILQSVSVQGVVAGLRFAGRLILILMVCTVMTGTTSLLAFKNTIEWFLRPIPFIPEVRVATIINLVFVLIPVIFDTYTEMMNAQKSRCVGLRKNPFKRVSFIAFPLLSRTLRRADEIVYAMESRCYSETRTRAEFRTNKIDWLVFSVCLAILLFVIFISE
ncbi:MAG: energy-coupling factor transporter transmembrane protein EcfT [Spirochaetes bacterium]|nr:energy-coupling factor transporter transmembrane protein EcfT [Spirochaetota bacterium]